MFLVFIPFFFSLKRSWKLDGLHIVLVVIAQQSFLLLHFGPIMIYFILHA